MIVHRDSQIKTKMENKTIHMPVMLNEVVEHLNLHDNACIVDCTLGLGGHSQAIAKKISSGRIIGIDRDMKSIEIARTVLDKEKIKYDTVHDDYRNIDEILEKLGVDKVDGILLDLGISSYQLNDPERGFSFSADGPLDMRMDQESYISAFDLVNSLSEQEISTILQNFGQERWHNRIAHHLVQERAREPISSTKVLKETVVRAIPARFRRQRIHPATRTFQAIRIAVNRELEGLEIAIDKCLGSLKVNGRICVIAFHSLEDKIVKEKFRSFAKEGFLSLITKKPLRPSEEEVEKNPRARSARLRVAEYIK